MPDGEMKSSELLSVGSQAALGAEENSGAEDEG